MQEEFIGGQTQETRKNNLLSPRETEIAALAAAGGTTKELADALCVSENTIKTHLKSIYRKLGVGDRPELVRFWLFEKASKEKPQGDT